MVSSLAYMLVGVLAPYEAGFYLSRGNNTTCKMQGVLIQLGQTTSMLYNLFLSLYFFFVVLYGWRERRFQKMIKWVHVGVIAVGVAMAGGSVEFVVPQFGVCGILPPLTASQWQVSLFYTAPVSIVLVVLTTVTCSICWKVYTQTKKASKWMAGKRLSITRKVFWQSFWYVMAFYVTLPFVLLSFYLPYDSSSDFWIYAVTAVLVPLQGLMNAFVYFQRNQGLIEMFKWAFGWFFLWCKTLRMTYSPKGEEQPSQLENSDEQSAALTDGRHFIRSNHGIGSRRDVSCTSVVSGVKLGADDGTKVERSSVSRQTDSMYSTTSRASEVEDPLPSGSEPLEQSSAPGLRSGGYYATRHPELARSSNVGVDQFRSSRSVGANGWPYEADTNDDDDVMFAAVLEHWKLNETTPVTGANRKRASVVSSFVDEDSIDDDEGDINKSSKELSRSSRSSRKLVRNASRGLVSRSLLSKASKSTRSFRNFFQAKDKEGDKIVSPESSHQ